MFPIKRALLALFGAALCIEAQAHAPLYTGYPAFYRSLGGNLFTGPGAELSLPCTESPRQCVWVNAMRPALARFNAELWTVPGDLPSEPKPGTPDISFDGKDLVAGKQRWKLRNAINLAPPAWGGTDPIDPENLQGITVWRNGASMCLELTHNSSGRGTRYTGVLVAHGGKLYALPPLFASCSAILQAPGKSFSFPRNSYLDDCTDNNAKGLQVDYLLPDGKTRVARYLLQYPHPEDPYVFSATRQ